MILKKLRTKRNWSQEQLATMAGLSLRTIQRVEAGNSASLETLKSIASVFEIDISKLTEEITVIDKKTEEWKSVPLWVSIGVWGIRTRKTALIFEFLLFSRGCSWPYSKLDFTITRRVCDIFRRSLLVRRFYTLDR